MFDSIGVPRNAPNRQTWAVVRKVHDYATVAVVWDEKTNRYNVEQVTSGTFVHAVKAARECAKAGS